MKLDGAACEISQVYRDIVFMNIYRRNINVNDSKKLHNMLMHTIIVHVVHLSFVNHVYLDVFWVNLFISSF